MKIVSRIAVFLAALAIVSTASAYPGYPTAPAGSSSVFTGATAGSAGSTGIVPAPTAGQQTLFLRGDSTWATASAGNTTLPQAYTNGGSGGGLITLNATGGAIIGEYDAFANTLVNGFTLQNTTPTTTNAVGNQQWSPSLRWQGHVFANSVDKNARFDAQVQTVSGAASATVPVAALQFQTSIDVTSPTWTKGLALLSTGQTVVPYIGGGIASPELIINSGNVTFLGSAPSNVGFYALSGANGIGVATGNATYGYTFQTVGAAGQGFGPGNSSGPFAVFGYSSTTQIPFLNALSNTALDVRGQLGTSNSGNDLIIGSLNGSRTNGNILVVNDNSTTLAAVDYLGAITHTTRNIPSGSLANAEHILANYNMAASLSFTGGASTTITTQRAASFAAPTYTAVTAGLTVTNAATVAISGAPTAGTNVTITNPYALWVQAGTSRFDGNGITTGAIVAPSTGALAVSGGTANSGFVFTGSVNDVASNNVFRITNASGFSASGETALRIDVGYASGGMGVGVTASDSFLGTTCAIEKDYTADTAGVTAQNIVVWSSSGKVQNAATTSTASTMVGVAMNTVVSGGMAKVCVLGDMVVNTSDATCTAGASVGMSTSVAGNASCSSAPALGAGLGKISLAQSGSTAVVFIDKF